MERLPRAARVDLLYSGGKESRRQQYINGPLPMHEERRCYLALSFSCDAVHWSTPKPLIDLGCSREAGRVRDYPADGLVVRGDVVYYYVHRDMPTSNFVPQSGHPPGRVRPLVRHALDVNWLGTRPGTRWRTSAVLRCARPRSRTSTRRSAAPSSTGGASTRTAYPVNARARTASRTWPRYRSIVRTRS